MSLYGVYCAIHSVIYKMFTINDFGSKCILNILKYYKEIYRYVCICIYMNISIYILGKYNVHSSIKYCWKNDNKCDIYYRLLTIFDFKIFNIFNDSNAL